MQCKKLCIHEISTAKLAMEQQHIQHTPRSAEMVVGRLCMSKYDMSSM